MTELGGSITEFIIDNQELLAAGWSELSMPIAKILAEVTMHLPGGSIDFALLTTDAADKFVELATYAIHHGGGLSEIGDAASMVADSLDLADALTSFGLGIAASIAAGWLVNSFYEPRLRQLETDLRELQNQRNALKRLSMALEQRLPPSALGLLLRDVPTKHWGF
jgi:hypothetical protein